MDKYDCQTAKHIRTNLVQFRKNTINQFSSVQYGLFQGCHNGTAMYLGPIQGRCSGTTSLSGKYWEFLLAISARFRADESELAAGLAKKGSFADIRFGFGQPQP